MDYLITDYGAVADYVDEVPLPGRVIPGSPRVTNNRAAIQRALDAAHAAGGGRVVVPAGRFLTGSLVLRSNVTLHLDAGAWLVASLDPSDGIDFAAALGDGAENAGWRGGCFLFARHAENIAIDGGGVIYAQGDKVFYDDGADGGLHECPKNALMPAQERPRTTFFEDVENLTVRGITFRDAVFWTLHMAGCRHVIVDGVRILNDQRGANNDGIDPDTCQDVIITNCIVKCGDDAIVIKNTPLMAARYGACENVVVSNCVLYSHDSALKVGTETALAIRDIVLSDCVLRDCSRGVGIWARDGAVVENVHVHHVSGSTRHFADCPQRVFAPRWWGKGEPIFISATSRRASAATSPGRIRNITFDHICMECEGGVFIAGEGDVAGGAEPLIEGVEISGLRLTQRVTGTQLPNVFDEQPSARGVYRHEVPAVYIRSAADVRVSGCVRREGVFAQVSLTQVEDSQDVCVDLIEARPRPICHAGP